MRIFVALDLEPAIRERIARFVEGVHEFAPDARWLRPESLHLTLKFIGEKPPEVVAQVKDALAGIRMQAATIAFRGHGFFPTPRAARVFWVGIEADPGLGRLASAVEQAMLALGIAPEDHPFSPHLTLARSGSGRPQRGPGDRPNPRFQRLQDKLAALPAPDFGTMTAHEFFLYESKLSPAGSRYSKLAAFPLQEKTP